MTLAAATHVLRLAGVVRLWDSLGASMLGGQQERASDFGAYDAPDSQKAPRLRPGPAGSAEWT